MLGDTLVKLRKKQGYSQQEVADLIEVSRQTISNWECDQGAPTLDKAKQLAGLYHVSLDDMVEADIEFVTKKQKEPSRLLSAFIGSTCAIDGGMEMLFESNNGKLRILDVSAEWMKVEYERTKTNSIKKKETVIKYLALSDLNGFLIKEDNSWNS